MHRSRLMRLLTSAHPMHFTTANNYRLTTGRHVMNNPKMTYFPDQDLIHLVMTDEDEVASMELSPDITAELNADGELIGVEILKASTFLRDFILESTQAKLMQASKRAS
jgi:uncharacterized protein YuzE